MKRYLGVDLHRTQFTVCTRLENGRTYLRQWPLRELKLFAGKLRKEDEDWPWKPQAIIKRAALTVVEAIN